MPDPRAGETKQEWDERCMADPEARRDFPDRDQRFAFCQSKWENRSMSSQVPAQSKWLRADVKTQTQVGVDRDANVVRGFVVAQEGDLRGHHGTFNLESLEKIIELGNAERLGLKSRFTHPSLSGDGLGTFLGRARNFRMANVQLDHGGDLKELNAVRADLHLSETSFDTPSGDLGGYILDLAEKDPDAFASSLVLEPKEVEQLDEDGEPLRDEKGHALPPVWLAKSLHAIDVVDDGAAVDSFLGAQLAADGLRDDMVRKGYELLKGFLPGASREVVEARLQKWMHRALDLRFGETEPAETPPSPQEDVLARNRTERLRSQWRRKKHSISG